MKTAVIVFPASNCDRDAHDAILQITGAEPQMVWHGDSEVPETDLIVLPGGFSYGDDLGAGTLLAKNLTIHLGGQLRQFVDEGRLVLGICNGFQVLVRAGLLPGETGNSEEIGNVSRETLLCRGLISLAFRNSVPQSPSLPCRAPAALRG